MALLDDLATLHPDQAEQLLARVSADTASGFLLALHTEIRQRCASDGLFFLRFVRTRDEADPDHPDKPFPVHLEYIRELWDVLVTSQRVVVAKSRQMLVSWVLCAFCCWWARHRPHQAIYFQTQKKEDANEKVAMAKDSPYLGRCHFIETHLPEFMRHQVKPVEGSLLYPNGSIIQALPGGADQIRGKVASVVIQDEFAFQQEARGVYTACAPLIQKGAKFIAVSTPNGDANTFAQIYHGKLA